MSETAAEPKAEKRWYQFHLWHLLVLMTLAAITCSYAKMAIAAREKARHIRCENTLWIAVPYADGANHQLQTDVLSE